MAYVIHVCWQLASRISRTRPVPSWSCSQAVSKSAWHTPLLCVQWRTPDDGQFLRPTSGVLHCTHNKPIWHITLLCVQWKTPDDGQRNCSKHVEFYSKNKFEKLVHLLGVIVRIYHDARSPELQNCFYIIILIIQTFQRHTDLEPLRFTVEKSS